MMGADTAAEDVSPGRASKAWSPEFSDEVAEVARLLMRQPWLTRERDAAAIAAVRRNQRSLVEVFTRLGWILVVERDLVRLRKSPPPRREQWAASGPDPLVCSWFFLLAAAAESRPPKVGLGDLIEAARAAAAEAGIPAEKEFNIRQRRAIAEALRALEHRGVIVALDGDLDDYVNKAEEAVLLEVHHTRLLHLVANAPDVDPVTDPAGWLAAAEREPDAARRMRRRLVDDAVVHAIDLDEPERDWLARRSGGDDGEPLARAFGLRRERRAEGAAFVVPDGYYRSRSELGEHPFPAPGTVGHAALLLRDYAQVHGHKDPARPGWRSLDHQTVVTQLGGWGQQAAWGTGGWAAEDIADPANLAEKVHRRLAALDLVRRQGAQWAFSPATGRWGDPPIPPPAQARPAKPTQSEPQALWGP